MVASGGHVPLLPPPPWVRHCKTVETADNPVYNVPCFFFFFFFCKRFLCVFKTVSTQLNLFVCNILSKRTLKHRPSAQNTFIDVTTRKR